MRNIFICDISNSKCNRVLTNQKRTQQKNSELIKKVRLDYSIR